MLSCYLDVTLSWQYDCRQQNCNQEFGYCTVGRMLPPHWKRGWYWPLQKNDLIVFFAYVRAVKRLERVHLWAQVSLLKIKSCLLSPYSGLWSLGEKPSSQRCSWLDMIILCNIQTEVTCSSSKFHPFISVQKLFRTCCLHSSSKTFR